MLSDNLPKIMDLHFTANMEENLDKIAQGTLSRDKLLKDFYSEFEKDLTTFRGEAKKVTEPTIYSVPNANKAILLFALVKQDHLPAVIVIQSVPLPATLNDCRWHHQINCHGST